MKKILTLVFLVFIIIEDAKAVNYVWNGSVGTSWNNAFNWTPNGFPGASDNVTIVTATNLPVLGNNVSLSRLTINSGTLNLNGYTITISGRFYTYAGSITNGTINANVGRINLTNATISASAIIVTDTINWGGMIFNSSLSLTIDNTNIGSYIPGGNTFNGVTSISKNATATGAMYFSQSSPDIFNGTLTLNNASPSNLAIGDNSVGNQLNNNVTMNSTGTGTTSLGSYTTPNSIALAAGRTVATGTWTAGNVVLNSYNQLFSTCNANINTNGTGFLIIRHSNINGQFTASSSTLDLVSSVFYSSSISSFNVSSSSSSYLYGDNTFNTGSIITFSNSGGGILELAQTLANTYNGNITFTISGSGIIQVSSYTLVTFNGNVTVNSTGSGQIRIGSTGFGVTLASGRTIVAGTFLSGTLRLNNINQLGGTNQFILLSGTSAILFEDNCVWTGNITAAAADIRTRYNTYNGTVYFQKTGSALSTSGGGNIFQSTTTFDNISIGIIRLASVAGDTYNSNVIYMGTGTIQPAYSNLNYYYGNIQTNTSCSFGALSGTAIICGSVTQNISGTISPTFGRINLDKSIGSFNINLNVSVSTQLNIINGVLNLNSYRLTVNSGLTSAITRTAGYILSEQTNNSSKVIWNIGTNTGAHVFPFGNNSGGYIPFTFNLNSGNAGNVTVSTYGTPANNLPLPTTPSLVTHINDAFGNNNSANTVDRFWQIDVTGFTANATLTFKAAPSETGTITGLNAQRWNSNTLAWDAPLPGQTTMTDGVMVPNVTQFSPWALSGNSSPLPIELISFNATPNGKIVDLSWITETETNNDFFTIERSADGINFEPILTVDGAGNSSTILYYNSIDDSPIQGLSYYRLKQTDYDGQYSYSNIVAVEFNFDAIDFSIFPNPVYANDAIYISSAENDGANTNINIVNSIGQCVHYSYLVINGPTVLKLNSQLQSGIYTIYIGTKNNVQAQKLVIK
jgi:hypothetical protein